MAKFSGATHTIARPTAPTRTTEATVTFEGGAGFGQDAKTELFTLAVTNMVAESTFYESASNRDDRYRALIREVTNADAEWVAGLVPWLRNEANMRSASVVAACEYVAAGGPHGRAVVDSACARADEPGEVIGYWLAAYGRAIPKPVKRGVADAAVRLYNERSTLKYDTGTHAIRFGDVVDLTHPTPKAEWQSALFRHLLDRRHGREVELTQLQMSGLTTIPNAYRLDSLPEDQRRDRLRHPADLTDAGYTWERLSGWLPGGMDAAAWEAIIPSMGYMALLRNLRNFEDAKVSRHVLNEVAQRIADPAQVAKSRQFPYRFWSAYKNSGTMVFGGALEEALEHSTANVPVLRGRTLVMVDTSASMQNPVSPRSAVQMVEIAALFASAVGARSDVVLCPYANGTYRAAISNSVLRTIEDIQAQIGRVGHGTNTWPSTREAITDHGPFDRVVVFTDMQDHPGSQAPAGLPIYVWDLRGYGKANIDTSTRGHYLFAGFTDAAFRMISLLEAGRDAAWPWA